MAKYKKWILLAVVAVLLLAIGVMLFGVVLPYVRAESAMPPEGKFIIEQQSDGSLLLIWPEADQADYYCLEFFIPAESEAEEPEVVYRDFITGSTSYTLPQLPAGMELTLRVSSMVNYQTLGQAWTRVGDTVLEVTTAFDVPAITDFRYSANPDDNTVSVSFKMEEGDHCRVWLADVDGGRTQIRELEAGELELRFGPEEDLPVPGFEESCQLIFEAFREEPGLTFYGYRSAEMAVTRDDLLTCNLNLQCTDLGNNAFRLTWDETKGQRYEVQILDSGSGTWTTVSEVAGDAERSYTSPRMASCRQYRCRVVAVSGQTPEDSGYAAISEEVTFTTAESVIYATVWPVKDMEAYTDTQKTESVGHVKTGTAYCVLEETDGMFRIRLNDRECYIDSNYCMINLPDYLGDLCSYNITNSYSSIYMVHEFEIPNVTGQVTAGYENVRLQDGSFLVPLLYPTAQKLLTAARSAIDQGYRLKIYDAYRPNKATREIYDRTEKILDDPLPSSTYTGAKTSSLGLPDPEEGATELTYRRVMTGGSYSLNYFLARSGSMHNLGVALDLTLEELSTGREISMQTSIHDLSCYSVLSRNNSAAKALAGIMKDAGFGDLVSEWWHFQDNEARSSLALPTLWSGVSAEGWVADDFGWKYRTAQGGFYTGQTVTIGETEYTFGDDGYLAEN